MIGSSRIKCSPLEDGLGIVSYNMVVSRDSFCSSFFLSSGGGGGGHSRSTEGRPKNLHDWCNS
jgi:hypothetical protein